MQSAIFKLCLCCFQTSEQMMINYYLIDYVMDGMCANQGCGVGDAHKCMNTLDTVLNALDWTDMGPDDDDMSEESGSQKSGSGTKKSGTKGRSKRSKSGSKTKSSQKSGSRSSPSMPPKDPMPAMPETCMGEPHPVCW